MSNSDLTLGQLRDAIEDLEPGELKQLQQAFDQKRRQRLREITDKARLNAASASPDQADQILQQALRDVRA